MREEVYVTIFLPLASMLDAISTSVGMSAMPSAREASPVLRAIMQHTSPSHHTFLLTITGVAVFLPIYLYLGRVNKNHIAKHFILSGIFIQTTGALHNTLNVMGYANAITLVIMFGGAFAIFFKGLKEESREKN